MTKLIQTETGDESHPCPHRLHHGEAIFGNTACTSHDVFVTKCIKWNYFAWAHTN